MTLNSYICKINGNKMFKKSVILHIVLLTLLCLVTVDVAAKNFVVVIDPGHGGDKPGAVYPARRPVVFEKQINFAVSKLLYNKLKAESNGITAILTRNKDVDVPFTTRANVANDINANLFMSIHCNSVKNPTTYGASVVVMNEKQMADLDVKYDEITRIERLENFDRSLKMSEYVIEELSQTAGRKILHSGFVQVPNRDLAVLRMTIPPSIIVELDFISNKETREFLTSEEGQEKLADALYNSIIKFRDYISKLDGVEFGNDSDKIE